MRATPLSLQQDWSGQTLEMITALACVLLVVLACAWLLKRAPLGRTGAYGDLRVVGVLSISHRERLLVVQVGQEQIVLGVSAAGIEHLITLEKPLENTQSATPEFKGTLLSFISRGS